MLPGSVQLTERAAQAIGGHGVAAVSDVPDDLLCAICLYPAFGGVSTACEHIFHRECLSDALQLRAECPTCRGQLGGAGGERPFGPLGRVLSNLLAACLVRCPQDCGHNVPWQELGAHFEQACPNTLFACVHAGCGRGGMSRAAAEEHAAECGHATVSCDCGQQVKRKDLAAHKAAACSRELATCAYCKQGNIERGAMEAHLSTECTAAATMSLVKPMQDQIERLMREVRALREQVQAVPTWRYEFHLHLPKPIRDLPVNPYGLYRRRFGENFDLFLYPDGNTPSLKGYVSVFVGSSVFYDASVTIRVGRHEMTWSDWKLGPGQLGGSSNNKASGWPQFATHSEIAAEQAMHITITVRSGSTDVVNLREEEECDDRYE